MNQSQTDTNLLDISRYWFLTWTTYGTWLPGDKRGFTDNEHNLPHTPPANPNPELNRYSEHQMKGDPVFLTVQQADQLLDQFHETAGFRRWLVVAAGIMKTHLHLITGVTGDPEPSRILADFKSYGSRRLNRKFGRPKSGTWWTDRGSTRKLDDGHSVSAAVGYVRSQDNPLLVWTRDDGIVFRAGGQAC